jgi:ABC-type transport system substrate-binding protein
MRRSLAFTLSATLLVAACSPTPTPPPAATVAPTPTPTATSAPSEPAAQPIAYGEFLPSFGQSMLLSLSNVSGEGFRPPAGRPDLPIQLVYDGLYRWDDQFAPVPDLAAEPCAVSTDGVTITCKLVETTFHDGTPLTADDVAFTYELALRQPASKRMQLPPACVFAYGLCIGDMLESVKAIDDRTVEFRLKAPNATFLTTVLPDIMIDSRAAIEAAYAPLGQRAPTLHAATYHAAADHLAKARQAAEPDCPGAIQGLDALFAAAGLEAPPRDQFIQADGTFDACLYADYTLPLLDDIASSLQRTGLDAIASAYPTLSSNRAPIGTGPFRFVGIEDGDRAVFEANESYHFGAPATPRFEVRVYRDAAKAREDLRTGKLQWLSLWSLDPDAFKDVPAQPGLKFATFPDSTYTILLYNLRKGRLFADPNLRAAMEVCIDKAQTVDTATAGQGDVVYSPIDPISWAYQPDLVRPERDVAAGRKLIEASGWTAGKDGIYVRDGKRLATKVYVNGQFEPRVAFMDIVAAQVRDCGIELDVVPATQAAVLGPLFEYPHIAPGAKAPFDAVFIGYGQSFDPDPGPLFSSRAISSKAQPDGANTMGFSDPRVDDLLDRGIATYDQRERARIYRELQDIIAADRPAMFGWADTTTEAIDDRLTSTDGEPNFTSRQWYWELEKLVLRDR